MKQYYTLFLSLLMTIALTILLSIQCFAASSNLSPDIKQILTSNKIIVALTKFDFPPLYGVDKAGKLSGIDIDIANTYLTNDTY